MVRVLHLITGLETGGAERMLAKLVERSDRDRFASIVVSLLAPGPLASAIIATGVPVCSLGLRPGVPDPRGLLRLARIARRFTPDILQTWLYHADLLGLLAWGCGYVPHLIWNIRNSEAHDVGIVRRVLSWSSGLPDAIVINSRAGQRIHEAAGYRPEALRLIENGFDTRQLRPDAAARRRQRAALGIGESEIAILLPARYHPMKDHRGFLAAAARLAATRPEARFVLVGSGVDVANRQLTELVAGHGLTDRVVLLGNRQDLDSLYVAFDIVTLASAYGEGFPNVLGEAMSCGVPCAATDTGDSALVIGDTGAIVPPGDPVALAAAWERLITLGPAGRAALGQAARTRIVQHYELDMIVARYEQLYEEVAVRRKPA